MKRSELKRKTRLAANPAKRLCRTTVLKAFNPETAAKRRKRYARKLAAFRRSPVYAEVKDRSGGRCERVIVTEGPRLHLGHGAHLTRLHAERCPNRAVDVHHKSYKGFGGDEPSENLIHVCAPCHEWYEAQHPTRRRNRRSAA